MISSMRKNADQCPPVYQYTFRMPGDDREKDAHTVMWDYNVGLVRVTALFKSLKHTKVLNHSKLQEVSIAKTGVLRRCLRK